MDSKTVQRSHILHCAISADMVTCKVRLLWCTVTIQIRMLFIIHSVSYRKF